MVEKITKKTHPNIWQIILKISPTYPHEEARLWEKNYMGLVARYNDQGWMCTYYIVQHGNIKRIPDKPEIDFDILDESTWTEFLDIPKGAMGISTGIHPEGISIIDIFQNSPKIPCISLSNML